MTIQCNSRSVRLLLMVQFGWMGLLALISWYLAGRIGLQSAILGGLIYILPNAYYVKKIFQHQGARAAKQILSSFYKGEALKISLSIVLFTLVFIFFSINPLIFFGAYIGMQLLIWLTPLIFK